MVRRARGVGSRGDGSGQKPGNRCAGNHCLGWFHMIFSYGVDICSPPRRIALVGEDD